MRRPRVAGLFSCAGQRPATGVVGAA